MIGVSAGLLPRTLARVLCWLNFLSLLARAFSLALGRGFGRGSGVVVGVDAGLLLRTLARVLCWLYFLSLLARAFSLALGRGFGRGSGVVVGVDAGLLLHAVVRVIYWQYFLSLLATVRGGTSFLCPTATKKRSKENASQQSILSVPSVQTTAFGSRVERCSQNHGHLKPSFSRILTSPRFATSDLGQVRTTHVSLWPHPWLS